MNIVRSWDTLRTGSEQNLEQTYQAFARNTSACSQLVVRKTLQRMATLILFPRYLLYFVDRFLFLLVSLQLSGGVGLALVVL